MSYKYMSYDVNVQDLSLPYEVSIDFWQYKVEIQEHFWCWQSYSNAT